MESDYSGGNHFNEFLKLYNKSVSSLSVYGQNAFSVKAYKSVLHRLCYYVQIRRLLVKNSFEHNNLKVLKFSSITLILVYILVSEAHPSKTYPICTLGTPHFSKACGVLKNKAQLV